MPCLQTKIKFYLYDYLPSKNLCCHCKCKIWYEWFGLLANTVALFFLGAPPRQNTHQKQKLVVLIWMESSFAVNHALDRFFFFDSLGIFSHLMGSLIKNRWQNHQYSNSIMNISPTFPEREGRGGGWKFICKMNKWELLCNGNPRGSSQD